MKIQDFLRSKELKITRGRIKVLEILSTSNKGITADYIFEECKRLGVPINLSTVYRCLESFEDKYIIEKFPLKDGVSVYKLKGEEHKHLLKCNICKKEVEISCPMKQFEEIVQAETGFTLTEHNLMMKGVCDNCKENK